MALGVSVKSYLLVAVETKMPMTAQWAFGQIQNWNIRRSKKLLQVRWSKGVLLIWSLLSSQQKAIHKLTHLVHIFSVPSLKNSRHGTSPELLNTWMGWARICRTGSENGSTSASPVHTSCILTQAQVNCSLDKKEPFYIIGRVHRFEWRIEKRMFERQVLLPYDQDYHRKGLFQLKWPLVFCGFKSEKISITRYLVWQIRWYKINLRI
jgi:hypothetical protein